MELQSETVGYGNLQAKSLFSRTFWRLAFDTTGNFLASACSDGKVRVIDVKNGVQLYEFTGHKGSGYNAVFSSDGVLASSKDNMVKFWNLNNYWSPSYIPRKADGFLPLKPGFNFRRDIMGGFLYKELVAFPQETVQKIFGLQIDATFGMKSYPKIFTSAAKISPLYVKDYCKKGLYFYQKKQSQKALDAFQLALSIDSKSTLSYIKKNVLKLAPQIAHVLLTQAKQLGNLQQALHSFKTVIALDPKNARAKKEIQRLQSLLKKHSIENIEK